MSVFSPNDYLYFSLNPRRRIGERVHLVQVFPIKCKDQWSFLVPIKGGTYHIIPQLAIYTTYILPTTFYGNQKQPLKRPPFLSPRPETIGTSFASAATLVFRIVRAGLGRVLCHLFGWAKQKERCRLFTLWPWLSPKVLVGMVYHRPGLGGWGWLLVRIEGNKLFMVIHGDETSLIPYVSGQPVSNSFGWQLKPFFIISPDFSGKSSNLTCTYFLFKWGGLKPPTFFYWGGRKDNLENWVVVV